MKDKIAVRKIIMWVVTLLPLVITTIVIQFMPDKIPAHYDISGNIDRWGSKYEQYIFPVMIILFTLFFECFIRHYGKKKISARTDKERAEAASNEGVMVVASIVMAFMFSIMHYFFLIKAYAEAAGGEVIAELDINVVTNVLMGIVMIVLGNIMPKTRINSAVGLRTVWSMENDKTWAESNRLGGIVLMIAGVIIIIEAIIIGGIISTLVMLGIIIAATIGMVYASYKVYKKYK